MDWLFQGLVLVAIPALIAVGWKKIVGPIDHYAEQQKDWSTRGIQLLAKYGYGDISQVVWVIVRDIPSKKAEGYKPVLIGSIPFLKREVHLPRKGQGEYALLMKRP